MSLKDKEEIVSILNIFAATTSVVAFLVAFVSLRADRLSLIVLILLTTLTCGLVAALYVIRRDYIPKRFDNYRIDYVTSPDHLDEVTRLLNTYFGRDYNPTKELLSSWVTIEPHIIRLMFFDSNPSKVYGFYLVFCLEKNVMKQIIDNKLIDWTLDPEYIVPFNQMNDKHIIYIMYLIVEKTARTHVSVLLVDLKNTIERMVQHSPTPSTLSTMTSTRNGARLARANGFHLVRNMEYPKGWQYWERSLTTWIQNRHLYK